MTPARQLPLLLFSSTDALPTIPQPANDSHSDPYDDCCAPSRKRWYHYLPLCGTILLILAPQPSWLCILVYFHLQTLHRPGLFITHLLVSDTLLFMIFSSLLVCLVRDPGNPNAASSVDGAKGDDDELGLREALIADDDASSPNKWCRKCWAPKPERAHHCSMCGRCVLKMDHHCPWIGAKCIGHRTYPAFVHFLCCITLLAIYFAVVAGSALWHTFNNPFVAFKNEYAPIHEMVVMFVGTIFALVIGSFAAYHLYLTSTNQTTVENITPFLLLRYLPPLPRGDHSLSDPPLEPELSYPQRRLVKDAHGQILLYNVGFRKNWESTFGLRSKSGLLYRLWWGGSSQGDGKTFPRNPESERMLAKLAKELVELDTDR